MKNENTTIERVINYFGNAYKASESIGIKHQQFYAWIKKGYIPFKRGQQIENITNGEIKASEVWEEAARMYK
jgi:hypothetical protein